MARKKLPKWIPIGNRLHDVLKYKRLTQNDFSKICGVSSPYISQCVTAQAKINLEVIISISNFTEINLHWFMTGEGEMLVSCESSAGLSEQEIALISVNRRLTSSQQKQVLDFSVEKDELNELRVQVNGLVNTIHEKTG